MHIKRKKFDSWHKHVTYIQIPKQDITKATNMTLYNNLMDRVSDIATTIPLLCHCMFEQVALNVLDNDKFIIEAEHTKHTAFQLKSFFTTTFDHLFEKDDDDDDIL